MSSNEELSLQAEGNSIATISSVAKTGINQIDSLLSGIKWGENNVTFSFATSSTDYPSSYTTNKEPNYNFAALNDTQQAAARQALQAWGNVCNLTFTETTGRDGTIRFGTSSKPTTSWAYYPNLSEVGGDVWFGNSGHYAPTDPSLGNYDYVTYIHEIGHALGLKHPHGTDGSHVVAASSFDTIEYSVMSYRSYVGASLSGYTIADGSYPTGPMIDDIAAIQKMYGANYNYNSGDNVYKFDPTNSKIFETIWDGGGNDTYDLSAYTTNLRLDLRPGGWSTLNSSQLAYLGNGHYARGNVANTLLYNNSTQSIIENAIGGAGNDLIYGNQVDNVLNGGAGYDTLTGGLGNDIYIVDNTGDRIVENTNGGTDIVQAGITYTLAANVENLTLTGSSDISGTGNAMNNVLTGNNGKNTLNGGLGNDTLDGGLGNDTLTGGAGNDTYIVDTADIVVENINCGTDTIQAGFSYTLGANVENLTLTGSNDLSGTGNALNNVLTGNSGKNTLDGGLGADRLAGGTGDDTYIVDNIGDIVIEGTAEGTDTVAASTSYTLAANVEILTLTGIGNINGTGNAIDNTINGNTGSNVLNGGLGADTLVGGLGNDSYVIDASDVIKENANEGVDTVYSSLADYQLVSNIEKLVLSGKGNINGTGNELTNTITGNSGNNILDGGLGADTMIGGAGNDTYMVDTTNDVITESVLGGTDTVQTSINSYTLAANVENLILIGSANLSGTGNVLNNLLTGNSGSNMLAGGGGNDTLDGGLGADTLAGGLGNDIYIAAADDIIVENAKEGTDTIRANFSYILGNNFENLTLTDSGDLNGTGNTLANVLIGNSGNNKLDGGLNADTLAGGAGDDTYVVDNIGDKVVEASDSGNDIVESSVSYTMTANLEKLILTGSVNINGTGNALNNIMSGNAGDNRLDGSLGADTMSGGLGNDIYIIDNASDAVKENANEGIDTIYTSLNNYQLVDNVENLVLTGKESISTTGNALNNMLTGNSGNNMLNGGAGDDTLNGGLGADTLAGGMGSDTYVVDNIGDKVSENANEGIDTVKSGISYTLGANLENLILTATCTTGTGNELNNTITGNSVSNILSGGSGNDTLDGGLGADKLIGGSGDDTYIVDNAKDLVEESINAGTDIVKSSVSYTLTNNVENLTLMSTGNISATGNALNNSIIGNTGSNILDGGLGADTLVGGLGNDILYGGAGDDILEGGLGDDTYILGIGAGNDTIISYEGLKGNGFDTIIFQNIAMASIELTKSANDLICTLTQTGEKVDVQNWFLGSNYEIDLFKFSDGTMTSAQVDKKFT